MKRHILIYGVLGGILITLLKWSEYRFLVIEHSLEIYGGLVAVTFAALGIWLGISAKDRRASPYKVQQPHAGSVSRWLLETMTGSRDSAAGGRSLPLRREFPERLVVKEVPVLAGGPFVPDEKKIEDLNITKREMEVLTLIAQGMSNREIAEKLYVSENTVKTHSSRVFDKLGAKRRTQAVQFAKELGLMQ
jgi:DNA-binding CsgD family transcriptional regulator